MEVYGEQNGWREGVKNLCVFCLKKMNTFFPSNQNEWEKRERERRGEIKKKI